MLINIISTPRTGSVWYTHHVAKHYENSTKHFGVFEHAMNAYYKILDTTGVGRYIRDYEPGSFYYEHYLDDSNYFKTRKVYEKRTRSHREETDKNFELFKLAIPHQTLILDHHVGYDDDRITRYLVENSVRNIWIYRKNKRKHLASFVIACSTGTFTIYEKNHVRTDVVDDIDSKYLEFLMNKIKIWDEMDKGTDEIVAFEDLEFYDSPGFPVDGNVNSWDRISEKMKDIINQLVEDYENGK